MNVVFVVDELASIGGVQSSILNVSPFLTEAGHSVQHVTLHDPPLESPSENRVDLCLPKSDDHKTRVLSGRPWEQLTARLQSLEPAVMLIQSPNAVAWMRGVRSPRLVRVGQHYHGQAAYAATTYHRRFIAEEYSRLDYSVFLTEEDERWFARECGLRTTAVLPNVLCSPPTAPPSATQPKVLLSAGRFSPEKRFDRVIDAFERIDRRDWQLRLVGHGVLDAEIRRRAARSVERGHRIAVVGAATPVAMEEEYARASIFALGSETEGFGMVVSEAAARHLPVVAFDVSPGIREQIGDGWTGHTVPEGRVDEFAGRIGDLMDDPERRAMFGARGARRAARYIGQAAARDWVRFLERIRREQGRVLGENPTTRGAT